MARMIQLDARLSLAYDLYDSCELAADIGTDHAHLPAALLQRGRCQHMILTDISESALENARTEIARLRLSDRVSLRLGDGLSPVTEKCGVISVMGMGGRTIRIPVHMVETINKLIRVSRQLLQQYGREPTPEEIAAEMGISEAKVREIIKIAQEPVSLETPIGEEEDSHLGDFIPDDDAPAPAEAASFTLMKEQLMDVLDTLTPREEKVLRLRFGLDDGHQRTLEEVGKEFNVTRERIRQIEAKALRKLRHPSRSKKLRDYLD